VHDLYFYTNPSETVREMRNIFPRKVKEHSLRADAIIAISDYTKRQLIELLQIPSSRIYTIKHGIDPFFLERASETEKCAALKKFRLPASYLLFVGTQEPRKNLPVLIDAFQRMRNRDVHLVIAGQPGWNTPPEQFQDERIHQTGYVSKTEVRALYQQSLAVVFPSIDEGFGLPLLEGMASRVPVVASRIAVFKEVCNESCAYFDADRPAELAHVLDEIIENSELRKELIEKGSQRVKSFSWTEAARKTQELYKSL
jgi:alpha-1,3-rhamnosyl/mannosyltransferase